MTANFHKARFWLVTIAALVVAAGTFSLGQWQLRRASQKEALQAAITAQVNQPMLDTPALAAATDPARTVHRPATLTGVWQASHTVFVDNRPMAGKTGFVVMTPLALEGVSQVILVERGWVQRDFNNRTHLPDIATPAGLVTVRGRIAPPPSKLYEFRGVESGRIRQNIDLKGFAAETALPLMPVSLLQTGAAADGLLRDWAAPNLGVEKHYGYAFQWFALSALAVMLYAWFQVIQPLRNRSRKPAPPTSSSEPPSSSP